MKHESMKNKSEKEEKKKEKKQHNKQTTKETGVTHGSPQEMAIAPFTFLPFFFSILPHF